MKLRNGFVSNSSSSSYIIAVTRDFQPTDEQIENFKNEFDEDLTSDEAKKVMLHIIERMCQEEELWTGYDADAPNGWWEFLRICKEVVITTSETGPDDGRCINVLADSCIDKTTAQMDKIRKLNNENS